MNRKQFSVISLLLALLVLPAFSLQMNIDEESREEGVFNTDYLFTGDRLEFTGEAEDLFFAGGNLNFSGRTTEGMAAIGGTIRLDGTVTRDLILIAGDARIDGTVGGSVFIATGQLELAKEASITGDVFIGGGYVNLQGVIDGDLWIGSGKVDLGATVNGDVHIGAGEIIFTETGRINGNLTYSIDKPLAEDTGDRISGNVTFIDDLPWRAHHLEDFKHGLGIFKLVSSILCFAGLLIMGLLVLLLPICRNFNLVKDHKQFWSYALWGLIPFFLYPVAIAVLMVLIVTIPLGFIALLAALPLTFVSVIIGLTLSGQYIFTLLRQPPRHRFLYLVTGLLAFILLSLIPFVKVLAFILVSSLGWGVIIIQLYRYHLEHKVETPETGI